MTVDGADTLEAAYETVMEKMRVLLHHTLGDRGRPHWIRGRRVHRRHRCGEGRTMSRAVGTAHQGAQPHSNATDKRAQRRDGASCTAGSLVRGRALSVPSSGVAVTRLATVRYDREEIVDLTSLLTALCETLACTAPTSTLTDSPVVTTTFVYGDSGVSFCPR